MSTFLNLSLTPFSILTPLSFCSLTLSFSIYLTLSSFLSVFLYSPLTISLPFTPSLSLRLSLCLSLSMCVCLSLSLSISLTLLPFSFPAGILDLQNAKSNRPIMTQFATVAILHNSQTPTMIPTKVPRFAPTESRTTSIFQVYYSLTSILVIITFLHLYLTVFSPFLYRSHCLLS